MEDVSNVIGSGNLQEEAVEHATVCESKLKEVERTCSTYLQLLNLPEGEPNVRNEVLEQTKNCHEKNNFSFNELSDLFEKVQQNHLEERSLRRQIEECKRQSGDFKAEQEAKLTAYRTALEMYETHFGFSVTVEECNDHNFVAFLKFKVSNEKARFIVDSVSCRIIDMDVSEMCTPNQAKMLEERYKATGNMVSLLCTLRAICIKAYKNQSFCNVP